MVEGQVIIMSNVYDLVDLVKQNNGNNIIKAILPNGDIVDVGVQQYVEAGIYFMFAKDKNGIQTIAGLKSNLEYEASDECWRPDCFGIFDDGRSDFLDCEIRFANYDCDEFFDADEEDVEEYVYEVYGITVEDGVVYLHCEDDFVGVNNKPITSSDELTQEEKEMIKKALNYYGNRMADTEGYSSGEPYWDLMTRF